MRAHIGMGIGMLQERLVRLHVTLPTPLYAARWVARGFFLPSLPSFRFVHTLPSQPSLSTFPCGACR